MMNKTLVLLAVSLLLGCGTPEGLIPVRLTCEYEGILLESQQVCWWQVKVWDRDGMVAPWSDPAFWRMGPPE